MTNESTPSPGMRESALFDRNVIHEIQRKAREGIYDIRGFGAKRKVPHFDDLLLLGASVSRYPLEGYRERCNTAVTLGTRYAKNPIELDIPITIAGMSFGALSAQAKEALGRGATVVGTRPDDQSRRPPRDKKVPRSKGLCLRRPGRGTAPAHRPHLHD